MAFQHRSINSVDVHAVLVLTSGLAQDFDSFLGKLQCLGEALLIHQHLSLEGQRQGIAWLQLKSPVRRGQSLRQEGLTSVRIANQGCGGNLKAPSTYSPHSRLD